MPGHAQFSVLMDAAYHCARKIGVEKTILRLSFDLTFAKAYKAINHTKAVLESVGTAFSITPDEIICGNGRKNNRNHAIGFCAYYLHYVYKYEMEDVAVMIKKDISVCYKYSKIILKLNAAYTSDQKHLGIKMQLDKELLKS